MRKQLSNTGRHIHEFWGKHQADVLFGAGVAGVGLGIGSGIYGTVKQVKAVEVANDKVLLAKNRRAANEINKEQEEAALKEIRKDMIITTAKNYAPTVICSALGISCLVGSHIELKKRNATLLVAYGVLSQSFDLYRSNVRKELGDAADQRFLNGYAKTELVQDPETGEVVLAKTSNAVPATPYVVVIDSSHPLWQRCPLYTKNAVEGQLTALNDRLQQDGFLTWNEIRALLYDTKYDEKDPMWALGQKVGIRYNKNEPVFGGLYDIDENGEAINKGFLNCREDANTVTLHFHCVYLGVEN